MLDERLSIEDGWPTYDLLKTVQRDAGGPDTRFYARCVSQGANTIEARSHHKIDCE
jgi:hypothetical protein